MDISKFSVLVILCATERLKRMTSTLIPPLFNAVFHLSLSRRDDGGIQEKKSFSIYTTVKDKLGLPCAIDSYDVYQKRDETYLKEKILRYANWFAGSNKYQDVQECYEL